MISNKNFGKHTNIIVFKQSNSDCDINKLIGIRIKICRKMLGLSQKSLAESLTKPVSAQQLQKYESGSNNISIRLLVDIARVLGVSIDQLLGVENNNYAFISNKSENINDIAYLSEIAKVLGGIESIALKDKIVELVKMMAC
jgi:transcriptional regulator with XRE-family HTH domain